MTAYTYVLMAVGLLGVSLFLYVELYLLRVPFSELILRRSKPLEKSHQDDFTTEQLDEIGVAVSENADNNFVTQTSVVEESAKGTTAQTTKAPLVGFESTSGGFFGPTKQFVKGYRGYGFAPGVTLESPGVLRPGKQGGMLGAFQRGVRFSPYSKELSRNPFAQAAIGPYETDSDDDERLPTVLQKVLADESVRQFVGRALLKTSSDPQLSLNLVAALERWSEGLASSVEFAKPDPKSGRREVRSKPPSK